MSRPDAPPPRDDTSRQSDGHSRLTPEAHESRAQLYGKVLVGLGAFVAFVAFAAYDITNPTRSVPQWYMMVFLSVFAGVFALDIIQRHPPGGRGGNGGEF